MNRSRLNWMLCLGMGLGLAASLTAFGQSTKTYKDAKHRFSFSYPSTFKVQVGKQAVKDSYFDHNGKGTKLVKVSPRSLARKYHGEYEFAIWASGGPADKCKEPGPDEFNIPDDSDKEKTRLIDGHTFYHYTETDAGMSKSIEMYGYRAFIGKKCWQIQRGDYQASAYDDFKPFDYKKVEREWNNFVNSIRFK